MQKPVEIEPPSLQPTLRSASCSAMHSTEITAVLISATVQHTVIQRPTCVGVFFASHSDLGSSLPFTCLLLDRGCCDGNSSHQSYFTDVQTAHCLVRDRIKRQSNFVRFRTK
mmetsp:Transcript_30815/g.95334  ORF Transcript_30815/g.95334 Transcript_30815/m.95334 type:complete len:112 (+) Transcript_30815:5242-5577(+)